MKNILALVVGLVVVGSSFALSPEDFNPIKKDIADIKQKVSVLETKIDEVNRKLDSLVVEKTLVKATAPAPSVKECPCPDCVCPGGNCPNGNCVSGVTQKNEVAYQTVTVCDGNTCKKVQVPVQTYTPVTYSEPQPQRFFGSCGASSNSEPRRFGGFCGSSGRGPIRALFGRFFGCGG